MKKWLNDYINPLYSWTTEKGVANTYVLKPNGIYPTNQTTTLTNVSYNPTSGLLDLVGTSLPNMKFGVYYDNSQVGTFDSDREGNINASLNITTGLTDTDNITIQALSATNSNTSVIYPAPYTTHLQGFNPKQSFLDLTLGQVSVQMLFNGFTKHVSLANINMTWPAYATADDKYASTTPADNTFYSQGSVQINVTTPNNQTTDYTDNWNYGDDTSSLYSFLEKLPYQNGDTYTFIGNYYSFNSVLNNGTVVPWGTSTNNGNTYSSFVVNQNGIICTSNQTIENSDVGAVNDYYGSGANTKYWSATYGWMGSYNAMQDCTANDALNWYDPNQLMLNVAKEITFSYTNPINQIQALHSWVSNYVKYNNSTTYYQSVRQTFQLGEGVCANISNLFGALLKLSGFVSRQVWGSVNPLSVNVTGSEMQGIFTVGNSGQDGSDNDSAHQWIQVWVPSYQEWFTIDPTWLLDCSFGEGQAELRNSRCNISVSLVEWPEKGTGLYYDSYGTLSYHHYEYDNYFSYFKECEYEALLNMGRQFNILPGMLQGTYQYSYAQSLASIINWAANPNNSMVDNSYMLDSTFSSNSINNPNYY